jgi:hypothetical protein
LISRREGRRQKAENRRQKAEKQKADWGFGNLRI